MTDVAVYAAVSAVAAVLGALAGRVFAVEASGRLAALFAGTYVGAGAGLMSAVPGGSLLALVAQYLNADSSGWFDALDVAARAVLWGTASGAGGGLAMSVVVAALGLTRKPAQVLR